MDTVNAHCAESAIPDANVQDALKGLYGQGYSLLKAVADPSLVHLAHQELGEIFAKEVYGRSAFEGFKTKRVYALFAKTRAVDPLLMNHTIEKVLTAVLGHHYLSGPAAIEIGPGEVPQPLHRDDAVFPIPRPRDELMVSVMWPLVSFTANNGGTLVVPGSHRWIDREPNPNEAISIIAEPGDALIYRGSLWHGGGANNTQQSRVGVVLNYSVSWLRQVENHTLSVPPDAASEIPEPVLALLGYSLFPPVLGYVNGRHPKKVLST